MHIGELAERLGVTARTLRYWEERDLLPPASRTPGGFRVYGAFHHSVARGVLRLKQAGFQLEQIQAMRRGLAGGPSALDGIHGMASTLEEGAARLRARIRQLEGVLEDIEDARRCLATCTGCGGKTYDAACIPCLLQASNNAAPDWLVSLLRAAT